MTRPRPHLLLQCMKGHQMLHREVQQKWYGRHTEDMFQPLWNIEDVCEAEVGEAWSTRWPRAEFHPFNTRSVCRDHQVQALQVGHDGSSSREGLGKRIASNDCELAQSRETIRSALYIQ